MKTETNTIIVKAEALKHFLREALLAAGADEFSAATTADGLLLSTLRGVDSHGVQLLPHYIKAIKAGRINPNPLFDFKQTSLTTGTLDANHALGFPAGKKAMEHCMEMAEKSGMGAVSVHNSTHGGMLAYYTIEAAKRGFFALAVTNTTPRLMPTGAKRAFLGTNPFCYAFPLRDEDPLCYDAATTQITGNKIQLYRKLGLQLPEGVAADKDGNLTTDANIAELLVPFGNYKGFGIALLVDILCGVLAGMPNSDNVSAMYGKDISGKRFLGQFYLVFSIEKFRPVQDFVDELQEEIDNLRKLPSAENINVLAPGDIEKQIYKQRLADGIPLENAIYNSLQTVADELGIAGLE